VVVHENFATDVSVDRKELIKFWKLSAYGSKKVFRRILQHCKIGHFSPLWLISPEKLIGSSWKFYHECNFGQGSSREILKVVWIRIETPDPDRSPWQRSTLGVLI